MNNYNNDLNLAFDKNNQEIQELPEKDLKIFNFIKNEYDKNNEDENSVVVRFFKCSSFFDDKEEFDDFYSSYKYDLLKDFEKSKKKIEDLDLEERVCAFGTFIFSFWTGETKLLVYYENKYYAFDSEGFCVGTCDSLALFPLECLWSEAYSHYQYELDYHEMTEETFDKDNFDGDEENLAFVKQDFSDYQTLLKSFDINIDMSYNALKENFYVDDEE